MALTIKLDAAQMQEIRQLTAAVNELSANLAKWQGAQSETIKQGFGELVAVLGGDTAEVQQRIDEATGRLKTNTDQLAESIDAANQ